MNLRPLEPHSSTLPNCATPSRTLRRRPCRREKRYYSSIFAGECQAAKRHAARRKGGGRAANGRAGKHAPRRGDGDVQPKGRPSGKHRAPRGRAGACARRGGAPARLKKLRKRRPASASSASCRKQRPAPTNSAPRPPTALHVRQRCSRSRKAAPIAPSVHNRHPAPGKPYKQRPAPTNPAPHPKKPRQRRFCVRKQRPAPTNSSPHPPMMFPCSKKPRRQHPAPADSASCPQAATCAHQRRPRTKKSRADSAPRPQAASHVCQRCSRAWKAAPTAPHARKQHPTSANDVPVPGKPHRQRPAFTIGTLRRESRTNGDPTIANPAPLPESRADSAQRSQ